MDEMRNSHPVLLYDGLCGFCDKSIQLILRHDRRKTLLFAPLQSGYAKAIIARHPELQNIDSVVLVEPGAGEERIFTRSSAALRVARYLGGMWKLALVAYIVPAFIRDFFYDQFAKRRYNIFGKFDSCMLPSPEQRARFIDLG